MNNMTPEILAGLTHVPCADERRYYAEQEQDAAVVAVVKAAADAALTVPAMFKNTLQFEPVMLRSALFRPASGARKQFPEYTTIPSAGDTLIQYKGEELRQDDQRLLLTLLKARAGTRIDIAIKFSLRDFAVTTLGWGDGGDSVKRLRACLVRLMGANVYVKYPSQSEASAKKRARPNEGWYHFLSTVKISGGECSVTLDPEFASMFQQNQTFLEQDARLGMKDGLASWLWAYIKADMCQHPMAMAGLKKIACKDGYPNKEFNRVTKEAMEELQGAGLVKGFEFVNLGGGRGRGLAVTKV